MCGWRNTLSPVVILSNCDRHLHCHTRNAVSLPVPVGGCNTKQEARHRPRTPREMTASRCFPCQLIAVEHPDVPGSTLAYR